MFILYALLVGVIVGVAIGGDPRRLASVEFRWKGVVLAGFVFQVVLFTDAVAARVGDLGPVLYVGSTVLVLAAVLRNYRIRGVPVVAVGSICNLAAIVANGGYMPMGRAAANAMGISEFDRYSNSSLVAHPVLEPLTDIFVMPQWMPFANVFSVGDLLIGVGIVWAIAGSMRRPGRMATISLLVPRIHPSKLLPAVARGLTPSNGAATQLAIDPAGAPTSGPFEPWDSRRTVSLEGQMLFRWRSVQGKPVARRGTQS